MRFLSFAICIVFFGYSAKAQSAQPVAESAPAVPVTVGLLIDNSGSYRSIFERVITSATSVINDLKADDRSFVITFVDGPKTAVRQELTDDKVELRDTVENMFIEGGKTALIDAVLFAARYFDEHSKPSVESGRVLVIITDGDETGSTASIDEAVRALKSSGIRVLVLGLYEERIYSKVIDRLIKETNGAKFVPKFPKDTTAAVNSLITALRSN